MPRRAFACAPALVLALGSLAGCARMSLPLPRLGAPAAPAVSTAPYFATKLCGVQVEGRTGFARLQLTLDVVRPLPRGALVETEFQDTLGSRVLTASRVAAGNERTIELVSPRIDDMRPRGYETVTRVYVAGDRKQVLSLHTHVCQSLIDQRELGPEFR